MKLVVMDANAPWVRSLFEAMPDWVKVQWFRPQALSFAMRQGARWFSGGSQRQVTDRIEERRFTYPGWRKFPQWSTRTTANQLRRVTSRGEATTVIYTLPFYSDVATRLTDVPAVYFAFDPYDTYLQWDPEEVHRREAALLERCQAAFAISPALAEDFRTTSHGPVFVQPNGISKLRMAECLQSWPRPSEFPLSGVTAVCVGQIGPSYDWALLDEATARCRRITFVFVGPRQEMGGESALAASRVFARSNVRWLGAKQPEELAAYMCRSDVLFSPLAVTDANNRRSLLRIYDYLATDRPVVATPVASAAEHGGYLSLASTGEEFAKALEAAADAAPVDQARRHAYLQQHTWEQRAAMFVSNLEQAAHVASR